MSAALLVVIRDDAERGWPGLRWWWMIGAAILNGSGVVIGARTWTEAYTRLESVVARNPGRPIRLQVWGHGYQGAPLIAGKDVSTPLLARALKGVPKPGSSVWFRSCDVAEGRAGRLFMALAVSDLQVPVAAHCAVISSPLPWRQREICALRPGEVVWWSLTGAELPSCSVLRMSIPAWAYKPPPVHP